MAKRQNNQEKQVTSDVNAEPAKYIISRAARLIPRRLSSPITGQPIGVGGEITIPATGDKPMRVIREATHKEYLELSRKFNPTNGVKGIPGVIENIEDAI